MTATASIVAMAWSAALGVVTAWAGLRTRARAGRTLEGPPRSVLVLRPCAGDEPHLERALRSSTVAGCDVAVRGLVARATDEAMPALARVVAELAATGQDSRVIVTGASAPNMKAAQLACALELEPARADVVIVADSDVELSGDALASVLAPIVSGQAEAAWVAPVEICPVTFADRASAAVLDASLHAFPLLAGLDPQGMVGKLFAIRRDALDAVGGFGALVEHLGEDVELSRRLRARGLRVVACTAVVGSLASGRAWGDVVRRYARWMAVVRGQRLPLLVSYPLLLAATPLIMILALAGVACDGAPGAGALALALAVRSGVAVLARRRTGGPAWLPRALIDGLLADLLLLAAFTRALTSREIVWRGARLGLAGDGLVERAP